MFLRRSRSVGGTVPIFSDCKTNESLRKLRNCSRMSDSSSFTSLHELVQSHLSKLSLQTSQSGASIDEKSITEHELTATVMETGTLTPIQLLNPPGRMFPSLVPSPSNSDTVSVLAQQVANMLKAKELKRLKDEEEERLLKEKTKQLDVDNYVIDLSAAIIDPSVPKPKYIKDRIDIENFDPTLFGEHAREESNTKTDDKCVIDEILPCPVDLQHLLTTKYKMKKCSPFGRVFCARYEHKRTPYERVRLVFKHNIPIFDFSTPSPDQLAFKCVKKPDKRFDLFAEFGLQKSEMLLEREKKNGFKNQRGICMF